MRNLCHLLAVLGMTAVLGTPVQASEPDLRDLERTGALDRLDSVGVWQRVHEKGRLTLTCMSCEVPLRVTLVVQDHYADGHPSRLNQRYLTEREAYCQALVAKRQGRCVQTDKVSVRMLGGWRSTAVVGQTHQMETVLFYAHYSLTAIIQERGGLDRAGQISDVLDWALLRMTPLW